MCFPIDPSSLDRFTNWLRIYMSAHENKSFILPSNINAAATGQERNNSPFSRYNSHEKLSLAVLYLNKVETRDKICRSMQYGSRFLSNGEPGTTQNVEKSVSFARNVFRLFKLSPSAPGTPIHLIFLGKTKNALLSTFLFLDQSVLGKSGIYKNKERTELIGRYSLFCWLGSFICNTFVEIGEIVRLSISMKKLEKN